MPQTANRPARYEDLFGLPEYRVGEIIGGELVTHPRSGPRHAKAASSLAMLVGPPFQHGRGGPGDCWILVEPELHLGEDILVPDLVGWRRRRLPTLPRTAWFELAPDWVCEVVSPSTAGTDRLRKLPRYAAQGIPHCWLVDPETRAVEAFELEAGRWVLAGSAVGSMEAALPPFAAVPFPLGELWGDAGDEEG
jgi:Uma2 family endonuclease